MKILFGFIVYTVLISSSCGNGKDCCSTPYLLNGMCADGTNLTIDCPLFDRYIISSGEGEITVKDGFLHLQSPQDGNNSIPLNRSCTGILGNETVVVACFEEGPNTAVGVHMKIYSICLFISDLFLVLTLIVYMAFPTLRDLQGKSVMSFTICLCLGYFLLAVMQQEYFGYSLPLKVCKSMGFILYYFLLGAFFWLSIISFNIWKSATWQVKWSDSQLNISYNVIGYGAPAMLLIAAILAHHTPGNHIKPNFTTACWFTDKAETWAYFYGPIGILLTFNILFFTFTVIRLWKDYKDSNPGTRIQVLRFKCLLYLKLFLTMGISWIFEIVSYIFDPNMWYITDLINCLQGVIIFIVMVATRRRVLRLIANSGFFGTSFNKHWQTVVNDEESENEVQAEQIQLS